MSNVASQMLQIFFGKLSSLATSIEAHPMILKDNIVLSSGRSGLNIGESCPSDDKHSLQTSLSSRDKISCCSSRKKKLNNKINCNKIYFLRLT